MDAGHLLGASSESEFSDQNLYNRPLKPWVEPGQQLAGAAFDLGAARGDLIDQLVGDG